MRAGWSRRSAPAAESGGGCGWAAPPAAGPRGLRPGGTGARAQLVACFMAGLFLIAGSARVGKRPHSAPPRPRRTAPPRLSGTPAAIFAQYRHPDQHRTPPGFSGAAWAVRAGDYAGSGKDGWPRSRSGWTRVQVRLSLAGSFSGRAVAMPVKITPSGGAGPRPLPLGHTATAPVKQCTDKFESVSSVITPGSAHQECAAHRRTRLADDLAATACSTWAPRAVIDPGQPPACRAEQAPGVENATSSGLDAPSRRGSPCR